jgi:hypothetical protein
MRPALQAVMRIHEILVRIRMRIRIRGSIPLTNGSGLVIASDLQDVHKKLFFAYFFLKVHLNHFLKITSHKELSHKTVGINVFLTIFAW